MSWWVYLKDRDGHAVNVPHHMEGGTYVAGGTYAVAGIATAELNVTYNYSPHYREHLDEDEGLRWLDGKAARDTLDAMEKAVGVLDVVRDADYWKATPGNAGHALAVLLAWGKLHPDAVWRVS